MMMVLASDYDRTFYLSDVDILKNKKLVETFREKGNLFILNTGRSYLDFKKKEEAYDLKYDYVILNHGATILDKSNQVLANFSMEDKVIPKVEKMLELEKAADVFCCSILNSRVDFNHLALTKIHVRYQEEIAPMVKKKLDKVFSKEINVYLISNYTIEIVSSNSNKAKALDVLLKKLKIDKNNVFAIGDGYSDIEMVKEYNGYCMENSIDELKKVAIDEVSSVSQLIEKLLNDE